MNLDGDVEIEVSSGEKRVLRCVDAFLVEYLLHKYNIIEETSAIERQAIVYVLCYAKRKDSLLNLIDMTIDVYNIVCTCMHTEFL